MNNGNIWEYLTNKQYIVVQLTSIDIGTMYIHKKLNILSNVFETEHGKRTNLAKMIRHRSFSIVSFRFLTTMTNDSK